MHVPSGSPLKHLSARCVRLIPRRVEAVRFSDITAAITACCCTYGAIAEILLSLYHLQAGLVVAMVVWWSMRHDCKIDRHCSIHGGLVAAIAQLAHNCITIGMVVTRTVDGRNPAPLGTETRIQHDQ